MTTTIIRPLTVGHVADFGPLMPGLCDAPLLAQVLSVSADGNTAKVSATYMGVFLGEAEVTRNEQAMEPWTWVWN